jgi:DNA repair exonuclease SbcCD nuclease subunit
MNLLIAGDFHITERDLEECSLILHELIELKNKYRVDKLIITGDTFDRVNPNSKELDCFSKFVKEIDIPIILLSANSHESTSIEESVINHFGILKDTITVVKEYHEDEYLFVGHFIINESKKNYGGSVPKSALEKYRYVVLGHGHSYELIKPNICQLGAVRYVDFAESQDKAKICLLIENYRTEGEKCSFLALKSSYSMKDVIVPTASSGEELQEQKWRLALDSLPKTTKIRLIFRDFSSYINNINKLEQFKGRFALFQVKKDFMLTDNTIIKAKTETIHLKDSLVAYLKLANISDEIKSILLGELK